METWQDEDGDMAGQEDGNGNLLSHGGGIHLGGHTKMGTEVITLDPLVFPP